MIYSLGMTTFLEEQHCGAIWHSLSAHISKAFDYRLSRLLSARLPDSKCVCVTIARVSRVKHRHISRSPPEFRREWAFSSRCSLSNFLCAAVTAAACFYNVLFTNCEPKMLRNIPTYFDTSHLTDTYPTPTQKK
jgi:hypothetical protein